MKINNRRLFLEEISKIPIVQVACEKSNISRQTFYRWKNNSKKFAQEFTLAYQEGVNYVNDMSEAQLLNLIKDQSFPALSLWLKNRNPNYRQKVEVIAKVENENLSPAQAKVVKEALKLASLIENE